MIQSICVWIYFLITSLILCYVHPISSNFSLSNYWGNRDIGLTGHGQPRVGSIHGWSSVGCWVDPASIGRFCAELYLVTVNTHIAHTHASKSVTTTRLCPTP